jgi:hypothetical protein
LAVVSKEEVQPVGRKPKPPPEHHSAAKLLGNWRAAERDTIAARGAATVAQLALAAAHAAEDAANETEEAAKAAIEVATQAKGAVEHARKAAAAAAEASQLAMAGAEGDAARADEEVQRANKAETVARDAFHDAERDQFPK